MDICSGNSWNAKSQPVPNHRAFLGRDRIRRGSQVFLKADLLGRFLGNSADLCRCDAGYNGLQRLGVDVLTTLCILLQLTRWLDTTTTFLYISAPYPL